MTLLGFRYIIIYYQKTRLCLGSFFLNVVIVLLIKMTFYVDLHYIWRQILLKKKRERVYTERREKEFSYERILTYIYSQVTSSQLNFIYLLYIFIFMKNHSLSSTFKCNIFLTKILANVPLKIKSCDNILINCCNIMTNV